MTAGKSIYFVLCCCAKTPSCPSQAFPSTCSCFLKEHATTSQNTWPGDSSISLGAAVWSRAALQLCCCHHVTVKPPTLPPSVICSDPDKWLLCRGGGNNRHCPSNPTCAWGNGFIHPQTLAPGITNTTAKQYGASGR